MNLQQFLKQIEELDAKATKGLDLVYDDIEGEYYAVKNGSAYTGTDDDLKLWNQSRTILPKAAKVIKKYEERGHGDCECWITGPGLNGEKSEFRQCHECIKFEEEIQRILEE